MVTSKDYNLPVTDTQKDKRNFPGYNKKQYHSLAELQKGDQGGMTESDSKTSGKDDGQYTTLNKKSGPGGRDHGGQKLGFDPKPHTDTKVNKR